MPANLSVKGITVLRIAPFLTMNGRSFMRYFNWIFGLVIAALFCVIVFFSSVESRYECSGTLVAKDTFSKSKEKVFIKIEKYRWWVRLWSPSYGAILAEMPSKILDYYSSLTVIGDQLQISRTHDELKGLWGYYSFLSKTLVLETAVGTFNGQCSKFNDQET